MRIDADGRRKKKSKKKKREQSVMEAEIFRFIEKSMKATMDAAFNEIFKDWK